MKLSRTSSLLRCIHFESVNSKSAIKEMQLAIQVKVDVFLQKGYTLGRWLNCRICKPHLPFKVLVENSVVIQIINSQFSAL